MWPSLHQAHKWARSMKCSRSIETYMHVRAQTHTLFHAHTPKHVLFCPGLAGAINMFPRILNAGTSVHSRNFHPGTQTKRGIWCDAIRNGFVEVNMQYFHALPAELSQRGCGNVSHRVPPQGHATTPTLVPLGASWLALTACPCRYG